MFKIIPILFFVSAYSFASNRIEIQNKIVEAARRDGVTPSVALAIARVESNFNPKASFFSANINACSLGIFQVLQTTADLMGFKKANLLDVDTNIRIGVLHLRICQLRFGNNVELIACCHNAGWKVKESVCRKNKAVRTYMKLVKSHLGEYSNEDNQSKN